MEQSSSSDLTVRFFYDLSDRNHDLRCICVAQHKKAARDGRLILLLVFVLFVVYMVGDERLELPTFRV